MGELLGSASAGQGRGVRLDHRQRIGAFGAVGAVVARAIFARTVVAIVALRPVFTRRTVLAGPVVAVEVALALRAVVAGARH